MAITKPGDLSIRDEFIRRAVMETEAQAIDALAAGANGAITISTRSHKGNYSYNDLWAFQSSGGVSRRDLTSVSGLTDQAMAQKSEIGVKIHRKVGPVAATEGALRMVGASPEEMRIALGAWYAEQKIKDMLNTAILAAEAAIDNVAALNHSGGGTLTHGMLNLVNAKFGDRSDAIATYVNHSVPHHSLVGQAITDKITDVANVAIRDGGTFYLGRRVIVSDVPALTQTDSLSNITYNVLGLVPGAIRIEESAPQKVVLEGDITGLEQIYDRFQAEFTYTIYLKGYQWDVANGGANPTDATLGTGSNWDVWASNNKDTAGVHLLVTD